MSDPLLPAWKARCQACPGRPLFDNRLRELHGLEDDRVMLVTERIARRCLLQTDRRCDIARVDFVKLHSLVLMHLKDSRDTLLLSLCGIECIGTGVQRTGIDAEISELSDERIRHDLERQR